MSDFDDSGDQEWQDEPEPETSPMEEDAYDLSNPKHPEWHSVHADLWDLREGK